MSSMLRLLCFVALFALLCATGSELCASGSAHFLPGLLGHDASRERLDPEPLRSREENFRGISPLPDMASRVFSSLWADRRGSSGTAEKPLRDVQ